MTKRTQREERILCIHQAIASAARQMEMDWPKSALDDPMLTGDKHILFKARVHETECLKQAASIIEAMFVDADGFATLFELAARDLKVWAALVTLAKIELDRLAGLLPPLNITAEA